MSTDTEVWDDIDRLPHDTEAEQYVVGAMLFAGNALPDVVAQVAADDFYRPAHEVIFRAILAQDADGAPVEPFAIATRLGNEGTLTNVGGAAYLHTCVQQVITPTNAGYYARIVHEKAVLRRVVQAGARISQMGYAGHGGDAAAVAGAALAELESVLASVSTETGRTWSTLTDIWPATIEETRRRMDPDTPDDGVTWGYADVDRDLAPMRPGDLVIITGHSGGGKSIAVANLALHASQTLGKRALVHALEMSRLELGQRWASALTRINLTRIVRGNLYYGEESSVEEIHKKTENADNLIVDDSAHLSLTSLRASIRTHKPDVVIVDQLPLMTPPDLRVNREQQMTALAYGLKQLAKDEQVVIVAASQLNADAMKRKTPRPMLHDLRESKAIAHAANWVIALFDPASVPDEPSEEDGIAFIEWIVLKARQGRNGDTVRLANQYHYARLGDLR